MAGLSAPPSQVQVQVQKELDEQVGRERPVRLSDRARLTYLECVINEGMRIRPVSPVLIPHTAMTDSRYEPDGLLRGPPLGREVREVRAREDLRGSGLLQLRSFS